MDQKEMEKVPFITEMANNLQRYGIKEKYGKQLFYFPKQERFWMKVGINLSIKNM